MKEKKTGKGCGQFLFADTEGTQVQLTCKLYLCDRLAAIKLNYDKLYVT